MTRVLLEMRSCVLPRTVKHRLRRELAIKVHKCRGVIDMAVVVC